MDASQNSCWILEPYGGSKPSSECIRLGDFYSVESASICGPHQEPGSPAEPLTEAALA